MRMFFPLFRYLLMIMIVVLPLQGGAAIVMSYGAGTAMVRGMHDMRSAAHAAANVVAAEGHCAHAVTAERKATSTHMKCNASANCCVGAVAPPSAPARLPPRFLSTPVQAAREPAMTVFVPPALERPPRLS
jgi:hypothetical protein